MNEKELLKRKTIVNMILVLIIIILIIFGIVSYKKYFDEKREQEIGNTIHNAFYEMPTNIERAEEALSVMDRMSFSQNGDVLFISVYNIDDDLKLGDLGDRIENVKDESWFSWNHVVVDIFHYKLGMVTSIETNLDTMEIRSYGWYDKEINENQKQGKLGKDDEEQTQENEPKQESVLIYEDDKVKISFAEITDKGVSFWVENLTDINITVQADSVAINGISTNDILMSDDVAPKSKGKVVARCDDFSIDTKVEKIGGQLRIVDFTNSLKSYDATFSDVSIE